MKAPGDEISLRVVRPRMRVNANDERFAAYANRLHEPVGLIRMKRELRGESDGRRRRRPIDLLVPYAIAVGRRRSRRAGAEHVVILHDACFRGCLVGQLEWNLNGCFATYDSALSRRSFALSSLPAPAN